MLNSSRGHSLQRPENDAAAAADSRAMERRLRRPRGTTTVAVIAGALLGSAAIVGGGAVAYFKPVESWGSLTALLSGTAPAPQSSAERPAVTAEIAAPLSIKTQEALPGPGRREPPPVAPTPPAPAVASVPEMRSELRVAPEMRLAEAPSQPSIPQVTARRGLSSAEASSLVSRAREKIEQGDIAAARRLLERAAEGDHGEAIFALAETYDPKALARWRVLGTKADPALARSLYQKAASRGAKGTGERLLAMQ